MSTTFKYNIGRKIILKDGSMCIITKARKHNYEVEQNGKKFNIWGFDITEENGVLKENG